MESETDGEHTGDAHRRQPPAQTSAVPTRAHPAAPLATGTASVTKTQAASATKTQAASATDSQVSPQSSPLREPATAAPTAAAPTMGAFRWLWAGQAVSDAGSALSALVIPVLALTVLDASPLQVGLLSAVAGGAVLLAAPVSGVLVSRWSARTVLLACDGVRLVGVASLPAASAAGVLGLGQVYLVSAVVAGAAVVAGVACHSLVPSVVGPAGLDGANGALAATEAGARTLGPAAGGAAVAVLGASGALWLDAGSYLVSIVCLLRLPGAAQPAQSAQPAVTAHPGPHDPAPVTPSRSRLSGLVEGYALVRADAVLAHLVAATLCGLAALSMSGAVVLVFLVRDLGLSASGAGVVLAGAEAAGVGAAVLSPAATRRWGSARVLVATCALAPAGFGLLLLPPVGQPGAGAPAPTAVVGAVAAVLMGAWAARFVTFDVVQYSYRQRFYPAGQLGQVNAAVRTLVGVAALVGALAGAVGAQVLGVPAVIAVAGTLMCASCLGVLLGPVRRQRDLQPLGHGAPSPGHTARSQPEPSPSPARAHGDNTGHHPI